MPRYRALCVHGPVFEDVGWLAAHCFVDRGECGESKGFGFVVFRGGDVCPGYPEFAQVLGDAHLFVDLP